MCLLGEQDRADAVGTEIVKCFTELVRATVVQDADMGNDGAGATYPSFTAAAVARAHVGGVGAPPQLPRLRPSVDLLEVRRARLKAAWCGGVRVTAGVWLPMLQAKADDVVREAVKQLGAKAKKLGTAKVSMWKMLRELARVLGPRLAPFIAPIIPQAQVRDCTPVAAHKLRAHRWRRGCGRPASRTE